MRSGKESGLSPSFSSGNGHVPYQNLAGRPSEPAELWCAGGGSDGDGQSAEQDDVVGNADQRQARITSAPVGVLYPYRWPILNYSTKSHVVITYQMQIKQHKAF